jgi:glycosyltransferase involved in cell wall biosynthesis
VPVIVRAHGAGERGDLTWQQTARFGSRIKKACLQADAVIAPSPFVAGELQQAGYPPERLHCVFPGVAVPPPRDPDQQLLSRLSITDANVSMEMVPDAPLVVYVGRLHEGKGLKDLVYAWVKIAERRPNARLWIIGEGPFREQLYDSIVDLGLHHQIFLPGAFDDVTDVLAAADLFVLPSYEEGMSLALLEAMAAGVPTIATNIAANRLLITDEQQGLLVPPRDPAALRGAIVRLLDDRACAEQLAQQARERVSHEFTLQRMADQHLAVVQQAIAARR